MLTERVATKAMPVLSFTTDCGDALCLVDMVGDLLDKDDLVVATAVQPAAAPVPLLVVAETSRRQCAWWGGVWWGLGV